MYNLRVKGMQQEVDIKGNKKDSMGALVLEDATGREVGKCGTGFTKEEREDFWKNPSMVLGKLIQVKTKGLVKEEGYIRAGVYNGFSDGEIDKVEFR
jgi:hypothetical protein